MGVVIPQVLTEDRVSGAQVVDGSLRFDGSQELTFTPGSDGNFKTATWSFWVKRNKFGSNDTIFGFGPDAANDAQIYFNSSDKIYIFFRKSSSSQITYETTQVFRDTGWYHIVVSVDTTQASSQVKLYVNGEEVTAFGTSTDTTQNADLIINDATYTNYIGNARGNTSADLDCMLSNVYLIDGQTLGPEYFGYTDPLTGTWRPKKFKPQATPNDGRTWNSTLSGTSQSVTTPENAFNGDLSNSGYVTDGITFTPPPFMSAAGYVRSCRFYSSSFGQGGTIWLNGTQVATNYDFGNGGWYSFDMASVGYTLTSFKWDRQPGSGSNNYDYIAAIEINGVILLNGDTTNMGKNAFYLPFDGNSPIGQDKSGNGNDWTPVNFGGSNTLEKATGALPILNTDGGGKVARVGVRTDSNASSLVLALPLVGIKSDFSNAINSGTSNKSITSVNAVASSSYSNFYGGSWYFNGSAYLRAPASSDFTYGTGDFTFEGWIYPTTSADQIIYGQTSSGNNFINIALTPTTNYLSAQINSSGAGNNVTSNIPVTLNTWNHIAVTRESTVVKLFINGVLSGSGTRNVDLSLASIQPTIGTYSHTSTLNFNGYIQDFRIYKGLAKYTQNFIPASTDPDILPDTPSGVSGSSKLAKITDGAVSFDGSGDYLQTAASGTDFTVGGGAFSIECWAYFNSFSTIPVIFSAGTGGVSAVVSSSGYLTLYRNGAGGYGSSLSTNQLSTGRWYHLAWVTSDGSQWYGYVNGVQGAFAAGWSGEGTTSPGYVGTYGNGVGTQVPNAFISNLHIVKGTALYTSNFTPPSAPLTSVANTKLLCCKSNSSATAYEVSPGTITSVNAVATNFNPFTVNINAVRGLESGYCTLNPLDIPSNAVSGGTVTVKNGNLVADNSGGAGSNYSLVSSTIGFTTSNTDTGYYLEVTNLTTTSGNSAFSGFSFWRPNGGVYNASYRPGTATYNPNNGYTYSQSGSVAPWGGSTVSSQPTWQTIGDVFSVAVKGSNVWFAKNGIWISGNPATGTSPYTTIPAGYNQVFPAALGLEGGDLEFNFGQKPFKFPPPDGFQPLNAANVRPSTVIARPDQYVGITTWSGAQSGSGGLTRQISTEFQPDFVWIKQRNQAYSTGHQLYDSVRGAGAEKELNSSGTAAEGAGNIETYGWLNSFDKTGFTVKGGSTDYDYVDKSGVNYVAWSWKAGGNSNTFNINDVGYATASAAGLTAGTITPTGASVGTKQGFSIISYTGSGSNATIGHGLGATPDFVIVKNRSSAVDWVCNHKDLSSRTQHYLLLNSTSAETSTSGYWNTGFNSTTFGVGNAYGGVNASGNNYIAYCWHDVPGLQKFGSYTGNDSSNFIELGFRPAFIIIKNATKTASTFSSWMIQDAERSPYNPTSGSNKLWANRSTQEGYRGDGSSTANLSANDIDFDSNGFYIPSSASTETNETGQTFIYCAWAEAPSFNLYGAQSNAR